MADRKLRIAIARVGDRLYAFDDLCTCSDEQCPLSGGLLRGTTLMCQCHGPWFDITTGAVIGGQARKALNVYDVREVDGDIHLRIGAATVDAERSLLYFGGLGGTDLLRLLAWTGVVVALVLLSISRKLARQREGSLVAGAPRPPTGRFAREH